MYDPAMRPAALLLLLFWTPMAAAQPARLPASTELSAARGTVRSFATPRASAAALASARRYLCPNGGTPQGRGRCTRGAGITAGLGLLGDDPGVRDWDQGLAPPNRAQAPCPPGTRPSPARDQPSVTRCIAG